VERAHGLVAGAADPASLGAGVPLPGSTMVVLCCHAPRVFARNSGGGGGLERRGQRRLWGGGCLQGGLRRAACSCEPSMASPSSFLFHTCCGGGVGGGADAAGVPAAPWWCGRQRPARYGWLRRGLYLLATPWLATGGEQPPWVRGQGDILEVVSCSGAASVLHAQRC